MEAQLRLLTAPERSAADSADAPRDVPPALDTADGSWRLSASTRALGRRGIAHTRAALARARRTDQRPADGPGGDPSRADRPRPGHDGTGRQQTSAA